MWWMMMMMKERKMKIISKRKIIECIIINFSHFTFFFTPTHESLSFQWATHLMSRFEMTFDWVELALIALWSRSVFVLCWIHNIVGILSEFIKSQSWMDQINFNFYFHSFDSFISLWLMSGEEREKERCQTQTIFIRSHVF